MGVVKISKTRLETKCDNEAAEKLKPRQKSETGLLQNPTMIFVDF